MKKNIYYIEDSDLDFKNFQDELTNGKIQICPDINDWQSEMEIIKLYFQNSNAANRKAILNIFDKYKIDLFIIDISIGAALNGGTKIYNEILIKHNVYKNKKFIFLSIATSRDDADVKQSMTIPVTPNMRYCPKYVIGPNIFSNMSNPGLNYQVADVDYAKTSKDLYKNICDLLDIKDGFWDIIKDIY